MDYAALRHASCSLRASKMKCRTAIDKHKVPLSRFTSLLFSFVWPIGLLFYCTLYTSTYPSQMISRQKYARQPNKVSTQTFARCSHHYHSVLSCSCMCPGLCFGSFIQIRRLNFSVSPDECICVLRLLQTHVAGYLVDM